MPTPTARLFLPALAVLAALTTGAHAEPIFADDFENPPHNLGTLDDNGWTTAITSANQTVTVVGSQSAFGEAGDTQAVRLADNDSTPLSDARFSHALADVPTDRALTFRFDFLVAAGNQQPFVSLMNGSDTAIQIELRRFGGEMGYRDSAGGFVQLGTVDNVYNQWYRATISIDPLDQTEDTYSLRIQSFDSAFDVAATGLDFRTDVAALDTIFSRTNVTAGSSGSEYFIDNVSLTAIPAPAALPVGLMMLMVLTGRRRG